MEFEPRQIEPSERILREYVEDLQVELAKLSEEVRAARDDEHRSVLSMRVKLKTQLIADLQRCIGHS